MVAITQAKARQIPDFTTSEGHTYTIIPYSKTCITATQNRQNKDQNDKW